MQKIVCLHFRPVHQRTEVVELFGQQISVKHIGCNKDLDIMAQYIATYDGDVASIALQGVARTLRLGKRKIEHESSKKLWEIAKTTPIVDGSGVRASMERWAVLLVTDAQPGIWSQKRVLMVPGLNHYGLVNALYQYTKELRFADPIMYFALSTAPFVNRGGALGRLSEFTLSRMARGSFRILFPTAGMPRVERRKIPFEWADVLAGDIGAIRRYSPNNLKNKIILTEFAMDEDIADLKARGVSTIITTLPTLCGGKLSEHGAAIFEACLVAIRPDSSTPINENIYLNLIADLDWTPGIQHLSKDAAVNRFAFIIHPLSIKFIYKDRRFRWTKYLPKVLVERIAGRSPPIYLSRITGIQSSSTRQKVEGFLYSLGGTPRDLMRRDPAFIYRRLIKAAQMAQRKGARIMGLGAFTSVVGDAGITVAQNSDIAITSGNSLTVVATLEIAKEVAIKMGHKLEDITQSSAMVIGSTGSIGSVCSRLLAQAIPNITLVAPRPEKLITLKRIIEKETPYANVTISTSADNYISQASIIVTTTTSLNTRIIDISKCRLGAVICDIARPPDITEREALLRPDVLVIESGEILLPGKPDFGYDIGLPPGVAYACLAETALLALEGKFESFTLGRNIEIDRVKEIYHLYKKHGLKLFSIRSHNHILTDNDLQRKRELIDELRKYPGRFVRMQTEAAERLEQFDS